MDAPAYAVSKAGMVKLTRCLARAEAMNNILSYCIAPGWVETIFEFHASGLRVFIITYDKCGSLH